MISGLANRWYSTLGQKLSNWNSIHYSKQGWDSTRSF